MNLFTFIHAPDPTKVRVVEREQDVDEPRLLDSTVGRTVSLLLVVLDRVDSELEASVERLFDEGDSVNRTEEGNYARGGPDVDIQPVVEAANIVTEDTTPSGGADPNTSVFSDLTSNDFLVGGIRTVIDPDTNLHKVYVPLWNLTNGCRLDDGRVCREIVNEFAPPKFFASVRGMDHDQLFTESNVGAARQMSLSAETSNLEVVEKSLQDEVNALKGCNGIIEKERDALDVKVTDLEASVVGKEHYLTDLNAHYTSVKSQNDSLADQEVSSAELQEKITVYDNCMEQLEKFQDERVKVVNDKLAKLDSDLAGVACHLEEKFYPHLLNTIFDRRWLLTYDLKFFLVNCLNSSKYLTTLGAAISRAIEKRMQSGLAACIDHGRKGRSLVDVVAYNPDAKADFNTTLKELCDVDFPLLAELKSYKDASTEDIMNVLRLEGREHGGHHECASPEGALVDAPGMNDLQPDIE
nr:hypothetical protein [Tanacetum cinerariifolium]